MPLKDVQHLLCSLTICTALPDAGYYSSSTPDWPRSPPRSTKRSSWLFPLPFVGVERESVPTVSRVVTRVNTLRRVRT